MIQTAREREVKDKLAEHTSILQLKKLIHKKVFFQQFREASQNRQKINSVLYYCSSKKVKRFMGQFMRSTGKETAKMILR
jgi:hypothetical protein